VSASKLPADVWKTYVSVSEEVEVVGHARNGSGREVGSPDDGEAVHDSNDRDQALVDLAQGDLGLCPVEYAACASLIVGVAVEVPRLVWGSHWPLGGLLRCHDGNLKMETTLRVC
jgi:hypothetical protein